MNTSRHRITTIALTAALTVALGAVTLAQAQAPAQAPASPATVAAAPSAAPYAPAATLPASLQGLGLTQLHQRIDRDDGDAVWSARTREGTWLRIETDWNGRLEEIKASEGQSLSPALLSRLLPAAIAQSHRRAELAQVTELEFDDDGEIELKGRDAQGTLTELEFGADGLMTELKRKRWETRRFEAPAVQERLQQAGYRDIGWVHLGGKHAEAEATNRFGERVSVRLNDRGQIDRERRMSAVN